MILDRLYVAWTHHFFIVKGDTMRRSRPRLLLYASLCLGSALIAEPSMAVPPAPCSLLTTAEVEQVLGKLNGAPTSETLGHGVRCGYDFADEKNEFEIWTSEASWSKALRKDAKQPVMVSGLGDEAFMDRGKVDPEAVDLYIRKGATLVVLMTRNGPGVEEKLKTLGRKAVGRL